MRKIYQFTKRKEAHIVHLIPVINMPDDCDSIFIEKREFFNSQRVRVIELSETCLDVSPDWVDFSREENRKEATKEAIEKTIECLHILVQGEKIKATSGNKIYPPV